MATMKKSGASTADQILDLACELAQTRGFNGFSYRDLAREIGIRSASIHHHFPSKADLGKAMMRRYREQLVGTLRGLDGAGLPPTEKLRAYFGLYRETARSDRGVCLGGVLAAEQLTLAPEIQAELHAFFAVGEGWLETVLEDGAASGELVVDGAASDVAAAIVGALQGAMMVARAHGDPASFDRTSRWLLASLTGSGDRVFQDDRSPSRGTEVRP